MFKGGILGAIKKISNVLTLLLAPDCTEDLGGSRGEGETTFP